MATSAGERWASSPAAEVTVHFDPRNADLATTLQLPERGATIRWVKEELCEQVTFGKLEPAMFRLSAAANPGVILSDDTVITAGLASLLLHEENEEGGSEEDFHDSEEEEEEEEEEEADERGLGQRLAGDRQPGVQRCAREDADVEAAAARKAKDDARRKAAEESSQRIARAGQSWHGVLGVSASAPLEEIKRAFRRLALLHHPDKNLGNAEDATFKRVQWAYEEGLRLCNEQQQQQRQHEAPQSPFFSQRPRRPGAGAGKKQGHAPRQRRTTTPQAGSEQAGAAPEEASAERVRSRRWVVGANATKAELRSALSSWEYSEDVLEKAVPTDILHVTVQEMADWLRQAACLPIDIREQGERFGPELGTSVCYSDLYFTPEKVAPCMARLLKDDRPLVVFSQRGGRKGNCGLAGCILLDIFGFDEKRVYRLDGGFTRWRWFVDNHMQEQDAHLVGDWLYGSKPTRYRVSRNENGLLMFEGPSSKFGTVRGVLRVQDGRFSASLASGSGLDAGAIRLTYDKAGDTLTSNFKSPTMADWGSDIVARRQGARSGGGGAWPG